MKKNTTGFVIYLKTSEYVANIMMLDSLVLRIICCLGLDCARIWGPENVLQLMIYNNLGKISVQGCDL